MANVKAITFLLLLTLAACAGEGEGVEVVVFELSPECNQHAVTSAFKKNFAQSGVEGFRGINKISLSHSSELMYSGCDANVYIERTTNTVEQADGFIVHMFSSGAPIPQATTGFKNTSAGGATFDPDDPFRPSK